MRKNTVRIMCECAVLIVIEVVLNRFVSFKALGLKFGVSFVPMAVCGALFGPWIAAGCYAIGDILGSLIWPMGAYFPGFTLTCALMGLCYGIFMYKKEKINWLSMVAAAVINCGILGLLLNSLWMSILYTSRSYVGWIAYRLPQEAGLFILHLVLLPVIQKIVTIIRKQRNI